MLSPRKSSVEPIHVIDARTQGQFVLVPAAAYQVVAPLFEPQEPTTGESLAMIEPVAIAAGWLDPAMDAYDNYEASSVLH